MAIRDRILAARGRVPPDLVLKRARVVSLFTNEILPTDIAIADGRVVGFGDYSGPNEIDLDGSFVLPGNNYHAYDYALFWGAVRRDAERRLAAWHR